LAWLPEDAKEQDMVRRAILCLNLEKYLVRRLALLPEDAKEQDMIRQAHFSATRIFSKFAQ
jgi:hypothetical protein